MTHYRWTAPAPAPQKCPTFIRSKFVVVQKSHTWLQIGRIQKGRNADRRPPERERPPLLLLRFSKYTKYSYVCIIRRYKMRECREFTVGVLTTTATKLNPVPFQSTPKIELTSRHLHRATPSPFHWVGRECIGRGDDDTHESMQKQTRPATPPLTQHARHRSSSSRSSNNSHHTTTPSPPQPFARLCLPAAPPAE